MRASSVRAGNSEENISRRSAASAKLNLIKRAGSEPRLFAAAHQVLGVMVNLADSNGQIRNKSINYFAKVIGRNRSTVIKAINQLARLGYLERLGTFKGTGNGRNNYQLCFTLAQALRGSAREQARGQRDKKRAPHGQNSSADSGAFQYDLDRGGHGGTEATKPVAPTPPAESHGNDTNSPYSSLSLPCEPNSDDINSKNHRRSGYSSARTPGAVIAKFSVGAFANMHPGTSATRKQEYTRGLRTCSSASPNERTEIIKYQEKVEKATRHRREVEARVNLLITKWNCWERLSEEQINIAYQAEEKFQGTGIAFIKEKLRENGS